LPVIDFNNVVHSALHIAENQEMRMMAGDPVRVEHAAIAAGHPHRPGEQFWGVGK
jgi:hypothetical protein